MIRFNGRLDLKLQKTSLFLRRDSLLAIVGAHFQFPDQAVPVELDVFDTLALQVFARIRRGRPQTEIECHPAIVVAKIFRQPENVGIARKKVLHHVAYRDRSDELTDSG